MRESVQLFVDRALLVRPDFAITAANAAALAALCCRLEGIPLGIELAAARTRLLSVEEIEKRLDQRLQFLTGGARATMSRHRTLRSLVDWSYDLLDIPARRLLARLSVFAGGWDLAGAEAVCAGSPLAHEEILDLLLSLVDKSLVSAEEADGQTRYALLETVRQYAAERLREWDEEGDLRARHLAYFVQLAQSSPPGEHQRDWLDRIQREHDNVRAALAWASTSVGDARGGLRLASRVSLFWAVRGYLIEGRDRLLVLLADPRNQAIETLRGDGLHAAAGALRVLGEFSAARRLGEESLAIWRALDERRGVVAANNNLGLVALDEGDYAKAAGHFSEALPIIRDIAEPWGIAMTLGLLADAMLGQGNTREARGLHEESLKSFRTLNEQMGIATALGGLGRDAHEDGNFLAARDLYRERLSIRRDLGDLRGIAVALADLAYIIIDIDGPPGDAMLLLGAAERLREDTSCPLVPREVVRHRGYLARGMTDCATAEAKWRDGRAMALDDVVEFALSQPTAR